MVLIKKMLSTYCWFLEKNIKRGKIGNRFAVQWVSSVPYHLVSHCGAWYKFEFNDKSLDSNNIYEQRS